MAEPAAARACCWAVGYDRGGGGPGEFRAVLASDRSSPEIDEVERLLLCYPERAFPESTRHSPREAWNDGHASDTGIGEAARSAGRLP